MHFHRVSGLLYVCVRRRRCVWEDVVLGQMLTLTAPEERTGGVKGRLLLLLQEIMSGTVP